MYGYLPITTDSHLGEYIQWAYSVADHEAILDFYNKYRKHCLSFYESENSYRDYFDLSKKQKEIFLKMSMNSCGERLVQFFYLGTAKEQKLIEK